MKKYLLLLVTLLSVPAFSQTDSYEGFDVYDLGTKADFKRSTFGIELGLGQDADYGDGPEVEVGMRFQRNFTKWLSWDILSLKYGHTNNEYEEYYFGRHNYEEAAINKVSLMSGVRFFTPSLLAKKKLSLYLSFDFGYGYSFGDRDNVHAVATDLSFGIQFKRVHMGYGLDCHKNPGSDGRLMAHSFRIGLDL